MAVTITKADVLLVAAELNAVTDSEWAGIFDQVNEEVGIGNLGTQKRVDIAGVQLAAHLATVQQIRKGGGSTPGPLTSITIGGVSKSFAAPTMTRNQALESTKYGQEYLRLIRLFGRRFLVP